MDNQEKIEKYLRVILQLMLEKREKEFEGTGAPKIEIVLYESGYTPTEISEILGRKLETVKSTLKRNKRK